MKVFFSFGTLITKNIEQNIDFCLVRIREQRRTGPQLSWLERHICNVEVKGSSPLGSTLSARWSRLLFIRLWIFSIRELLEANNEQLCSILSEGNQRRDSSLISEEVSLLYLNGVNFLTVIQQQLSNKTLMTFICKLMQVVDALACLTEEGRLRCESRRGAPKKLRSGGVRMG